MLSAGGGSVFVSISAEDLTMVFHIINSKMIQFRFKFKK